MTARVDSGTEEKSIPRNRRGMGSINDDQAIELARFGIKIEEIYQRPMDIEWAIHENSVFILQARPITALPMADDWEIPDPRGTYARGSLAEHIPSPVTPLFRTMGLRIANESTNKMYDEFMGTEKDKQWFVGGNMYLPINLYVYAGFRLTLKDALPLIKISFKQTGPIMKGSVKRWKEAQKQFSSIVESWESKNIDLFSPSELIESAKIVFRAAADYYTVVQTILPAVSTSEMFFQWYFNSLVKRKTDPDYTSLLFGFETQPLRAEKSLYNLARWIKENEALSHTLIQNESTIITKNIRDRKIPHGVTNDVWCEFETRFQDFIDTFGKTAYEFDFGIPTPAENPIPQIEAIKHFIRDDAENPYIRHEKAIEERENYEKEILSRLGILRKKPFIKLLKWAQNTGAIRENALADMGLGHNFIRRVLQQVGRQFEQNGAISKFDDIFWLEESEIEELADRFENGQPLPNFEKKVIERKREWKAALKLTPPVALPEKNFMHKLLNKGAAEKVDGKTIMKGTGTSQGKVTAIARVLKGPQDFSRMQSGDILVATTTTPAWTPLFMLASAVITDIGGPLSHGSIVAREYGIPAVMAVKDASRIIVDGERITVDGGKGFVILER